MMQKLSRCLAVALAMVLVPVAVAEAQPKTPADYFREGEEHYNIGNFEEAIKAFQEGYRLEPVETKKAVYVYNIAQSYRLMGGQCAKAQFAYKRFLAIKERDTAKPLAPKTREVVEGYIRELETCARAEDAAAKRPPEAPPEDPKPQPKPDEVAVKPQPEPEPEPEIEVVEQSDGTPRLLSARLVGGGAAIQAGTLEIPVQATAALLAGYPIRLGEKLTIEPGAGFTFTPVPYINMVTNEEQQSAMTAIVANAGLAYQVAEKISVRGDLGAGILMFSGVSGSPFTKGAPTSGSLVMPHVRIGLSADYAITPNLLATATPIAFSYSPPKEGLRDDIKAITAIDFMIGLGYRM